MVRAGLGLPVALALNAWADRLNLSFCGAFNRTSSAYPPSSGSAKHPAERGGNSGDASQLAFLECSDMLDWDEFAAVVEEFGFDDVNVLNRAMLLNARIFEVLQKAILILHTSADFEMVGLRFRIFLRFVFGCINADLCN